MFVPERIVLIKRFRENSADDKKHAKIPCFNLMKDNNVLAYQDLPYRCEYRHYNFHLVLQFFVHPLLACEAIAGFQVRVCIVKLFSFYFSSKTYVVGTQKDRLN